MIKKALYIYQFLRDLLDNLFSNQLVEEKILKNAPEKKAGYFVVPKVVE